MRFPVPPHFLRSTDALQRKWDLTKLSPGELRTLAKLVQRLIVLELNADRTVERTTITSG